MGCDIHVHVELKIDGVWEHYSSPYVWRNYGLFGLLAGVRGYGDFDPIVAPRGLPDDITKLTRLDYLRDHHHHASWLNPSEVREVYKIWDRRWRKDGMDELFGFVFGNGFDAVLEIHHCHHSENEGFWVEDARVVFWFDN